ncbi:MAG: hypothetical protein AAGJ36_05525, partial [Pseudomonadota bacterium]
MLRVVVLLVLLCVPGVRAAEVLDEQAFTKRYAAMLVSSYEGANVEIVGPLEVRVTGVGDENSTSFLDNAYGAYLSDPAELGHPARTATPATQRPATCATPAPDS